MKRLRSRLDLTQAALADALAVSRSTIANWERGVTMPSPPRIELLSQTLRSIFDVDVNKESADIEQEDEARSAKQDATVRRLYRALDRADITLNQLAIRVGTSSLSILNGLVVPS